jgi:hypothetical protein
MRTARLQGPLRILVALIGPGPNQAAVCDATEGHPGGGQTEAGCATCAASYRNNLGSGAACIGEAAVNSRDADPLPESEQHAFETAPS